MNESFIIVGAGGHARVLAEILVLLGKRIAGVSDLQSKPLRMGKLEIPWLGTDEAVMRQYQPDEFVLVNAIGSTGDMGPRRRVYENFKKNGYRFATLVHPSAVVSPNASLGEGVQVMAGAVIQTGVSVGCNSIINTRASVDHDCVIRDHVFVAPGAILCGAVELGEMTHLGPGAVAVQGSKAGRECLIKALGLLKGALPDGRIIETPVSRSFEKENGQVQP